ncbi:MAG TPA: hypothetical protein VFF06_15545 [Polyangia bacterium]|nr:hypothetical protein [Polyangia bacterium]
MVRLAILALLLGAPAASSADLIVPTQGAPRTRGKHKKGETWVEVQLTQADGKTPVPFARYRIVTPDGDVHTGRLDKNGDVYIDHIRKSGDCQFSFPDYPNLGEPISH